MSVIEFIVVVILIFLLVSAVILLGGFIWMLGLGALAHIFGVSALAIGYWQSCIVALIVGILFGGLRK
jgi:hypothetical protein